MAFTEFCCRSGGSNLNAGTRTGNSTEPGTTADFTYASGTWVASTGVFTVASGNPSSDGVAVGDFASVYADGSTVTGFVGRVTARDATTITVSLTAKMGTAPTDGTNTRTLKIGGAWKGPNGAEAFPIGTLQTTLTNSAGDYPRVNFKGGTNYAITAAMTHANSGPARFQGYTTSYGDGGKATINGGGAGTSYKLLNSTSGKNVWWDLIFDSNGATGSADMVDGASDAFFVRCVCANSVGSGFVNQGACIECEAYSCNSTNSGTKAGFATTGSGVYVRCYSHDNSGSNNQGFYIANSGVKLFRCIADTNGRSGMTIEGTNVWAVLANCDIYNNVADGIRVGGGSNAASALIFNSNFIKNGGYGIKGITTGARNGIIVNCGFGAGTQANTSGTTNSLDGIQEIGSVTYAVDVTPWVDPANGDFRINLAAAINAGRGLFTEVDSRLTAPNTIGYPDIGAADHLEVITPKAGNFRGGFVN